MKFSWLPARRLVFTFRFQYLHIYYVSGEGKSCEPMNNELRDEFNIKSPSCAPKAVNGITNEKFNISSDHCW